MENTKVVVRTDGQGEIQLFIDEQLAGKMEIAVEGSLLTVYHTEVNPEHEGKGFAKLLLNELVAYARQNQLQIVPLCPYVNLQFRRRPSDYQDVWSGYQA